MNVHVSYKVPKSPDLEKQINQNIQKLGKRLQVFKPDLVHLHAIVDERPSRVGINVRLDLRLPSGDIAAHETADRADAAIKGAFQDLLERVTKHKDRLRAQHQWPRARPGKTRSVSQVPFEETLAAVPAETATESDIAYYLNANLPRLQRFVERQIQYRENNGELQPGHLVVQEVIGEAAANALGQDDRPEKLAVEPWLYRLALKAVEDLAQRNEDGASSVPLEQAVRTRQAEFNDGSDESLLQFHQPDESVTSENLIPNRSVATPEESAVSDEMFGFVEIALSNATREDREAFLLFGIEGFTVDEISAISSRSTEAVRSSIKSAREHLKKSLPVPCEFKDKLLQHSKIV
jgi:DNA-directed RNA polymerase specialized sigma24 family protein/ribosome-associated translation inhibitor RaiA